MKTFFISIMILITTCHCPNLYSQGTEDEDRKIKNLFSLAKVYGYVRFFYPGDEAAGLNYPQFTPYAVARVTMAKNQNELKKILDSLFLPIAPGITIYFEGEPLKFDRSLLIPNDTADLKPVFWQHLGLGITQNDVQKFGSYSQNGVFQQMRTNRFEATNETFGNILTSFNAIPYRGKKIRLRAAVKTTGTNSDEGGHLWIRVDRANGKVGFFNNMDKAPIRNNKWTYYQIEGLVDNDADYISFGCFLSGKGKLWVDDISFAIEGTREGYVKLDSLDGDFEKTSIGSLPLTWYCPNKVYQANVTNETAASGHNSVLITRRERLFESRSQVGDYVNKSIGNGLGIMLPLVLYGDENKTYPAPDNKKYLKLLEAVNNQVPGRVDMDNPAFRIGAGIAFWNVFQHFYPYFDETKVDWEKALPTLLYECDKCTNETDLLHVLQKYMALLKDGHGSVSLQKETKTVGMLPFQLDWIENRLVVTNIYDNTIGIQVGDILVKIDGIVTEKYIDSAKVYYSAAAEPYRLRRIINGILLGDTLRPLSFSINRRKGQTLVLKIQRKVNSPETQSSRYSENSDSIKNIGNGIYYVNINNTSAHYMDISLPALMKAKSIIFDFRGYPWSIGNDFIRHLLITNDSDSQWCQIPQIIFPDHYNNKYSYSGWNLTALKPHLTASIIAITDSRAASATESLLSYFEGYKFGIIIGQPSAGTNGNVNPFSLSGIYQVSFTNMHIVKHDGSQLHGVGIIPNVYLKRTIKGVRDGRDEFLEKAIMLAKKS